MVSGWNGGCQAGLVVRVNLRFGCWVWCWALVGKILVGGGRQAAR